MKIHPVGVVVIQADKHDMASGRFSHLLCKRARIVLVSVRTARNRITVTYSACLHCARRCIWGCDTSPITVIELNKSRMHTYEISAIFF